MTYVDSLGGSTSYNTNTVAQETPKRMEDIPPANVGPAGDGGYTLNNNTASNSEFNWDAVRNNMQGNDRLKDYNPLLGKSVIH